MGYPFSRILSSLQITKREKSLIIETSNTWVMMLLYFLLFDVSISRAREKKSNETLRKCNQELRIFIERNNELFMLNGERWKKKKSFDNNSVVLFILYVRIIDSTNHSLLTYGGIEQVESLETVLTRITFWRKNTKRRFISLKINI
jgi:hypothetical protein